MVEEVTWVLACAVATVLNSLTIASIMQKRPLQLFDVCLINFSCVYLLQGNVLFISMALFSTHGGNCGLVKVITVSFMMLSFTKLAILVIINANQISNLRRVRVITPQELQANKIAKKFLFLCSTWLFSAVFVTIAWFSAFDLFPIIVIAILGTITLILRIIVLINLTKIGDSTTDTMRQTLAMVKRSIRIVSLFVLIELCSWVPSLMVGLLSLFGPASKYYFRVMNWCLRILFFTPMFYPFISVVNHLSWGRFVGFLCVRRVEVAPVEIRQESKIVEIP